MERERKTPVLNAVRADIFNSLNIVQRKTLGFFLPASYIEPMLGLMQIIFWGVKRKINDHI